MKGYIKHKTNKYISGIFLLLTGLLLCMSSCTDESPVDNGNGEAPEGEGYFSLSIKAGDVLATKAGDETGSAEEMKVHNVRVALYGEVGTNDWRVEYAFDFQISTPGTWNGGANGWVEGKEIPLGGTEDGVITPSGKHLYQGASGSTYNFVTFAQKVKKKPYKMLVLINGKDISTGSGKEPIYNITKKGGTINQLTSTDAFITPEVNAATGSVGGGSGFFMSNHQGLVDVPVTALKETADAANKAPVSVGVDRMVAKMTVKENLASLPTGIKPNSGRWALDVTNKRTYWMRSQTSGEATTNSMGPLYAEDPNYGSLSLADVKQDNFNYIRQFDGNDAGFKIPSAKVQNTFGGGYHYILENTVSAESANDVKNFADQMTQVVVGYVYTPEGFNDGDSYYVFKNRAISQSYMTDIVGNRENSAWVEPDEISGVKEAVKAVYAINGNAADGKYSLTGGSSDYYEVGSLRFCPKGQLYYSFPIRHFNTGENTLGHYGVVRNNIYDINIKSLNPPGTAEEGPFLSGEITIQPWGVREQNRTIGFEATEDVITYMRVYHLDIDTYKSIYGYYLTGTPGAVTPGYQIVFGKAGQYFKHTNLALPNSIEKIDYRYLDQFSALHANGEYILMVENVNENVALLFYKSPATTDVEIGFAAFVYIYFVTEAGKVLDITKGDTPTNIEGIGHSINRINGSYRLFLTDDIVLRDKVLYTYEVGNYRPRVVNDRLVFKGINYSNIGQITPGEILPLLNLTTEPLEFGHPINSPNAAYGIICDPMP